MTRLLHARARRRRLGFCGRAPALSAVLPDPELIEPFAEYGVIPWRRLRLESIYSHGLVSKLGVSVHYTGG